MLQNYHKNAVLCGKSGGPKVDLEAGIIALGNSELKQNIAHCDVFGQLMLKLFCYTLQIKLDLHLRQVKTTFGSSTLILIVYGLTTLVPPFLIQFQEIFVC